MCCINPQKTQGFIQRPRTWPGVATTDPESANTLAAAQCAQSSDEVALPNAHGAGPTQHSALSGGRAVANPGDCRLK